MKVLILILILFFVILRIVNNESRNKLEKINLIEN